MRFVAETPVQEPDEDDLQDIPTVLAMMGITEPLYPTWLPEDFMRVESKTIEDPLIMYERFQGNDRTLNITISPITGSEYTVYQKENAPYEEYCIGNNVHYIFDNTAEITAVWYTNNYTMLIAGNISIEEIYRIIDSVYEVRK